MDENVEKELVCLVQMVQNWRRGYLEWMDADGDNKWIVNELVEEISLHMGPYIARFRHLNLITAKEEGEFWDRIADQIWLFSEDVEKGKVVKKKKKIDLKKLISQFRVHRDLIELRQQDHEFVTEQQVKLSKIALELIPALVDNQCKCGKGD